MLSIHPTSTGRRFDYPKSLYAVEDVLRFFIGENPDATVLDFFAGSGTTAHAVARLNRQDGGNRRSITVTNNEVSADEAAALRDAGHQPGDQEWEALGIFEFITRPRIAAAVTGNTPQGEPIVGDYRFADDFDGNYKIADEFPMASGFEENVHFVEMSYLDRNDVDRGIQFAAIAPLLWIRAGSVGHMIAKETDTFAAPEGARYAILFDVAHAQLFADAIGSNEDIATAYIVTDSVAQYQQVVAELSPTIETAMLYEDYLRSFELNTGGAG